MSKQIKIASAFIPVPGFSKGQAEFDQDYIDIKVKDVVKKIGAGEDDFVIEHKEVISKRNISAFINSQAYDVGIDAYMRQCALSGKPLTRPVVSDKVVDYSGAPSTIAEFQDMQTKAEKAFNALDPSLKGSAKSISEFLDSLDKDTIANYVMSKFGKKNDVSEASEGDCK